MMNIIINRKLRTSVLSSRTILPFSRFLLLRRMFRPRGVALPFHSNSVQFKSRHFQLSSLTYMISVKNTMGKRRMNNEKGTQSDEATS